MHESALRDFAVTNFGANGCAYFKLPEEATAAAVQLKALLLDHGDELRVWLAKTCSTPWTRNSARSSSKRFQTELLLTTAGCRYPRSTCD